MFRKKKTKKTKKTNPPPPKKTLRRLVTQILSLSGSVNMQNLKKKKKSHNWQVQRHILMNSAMSVLKTYNRTITLNETTKSVQCGCLSVNGLETI